MVRTLCASVIVVAGAFAVLCLAGCYSCSIGGANESADALRAVPVDPALKLPGDSSAGERNVVVCQSYTITPDGQFTFSRSVEKPVGTIGAGLVPLSKPDAERLGLEPFSGVRMRSVAKPGPAVAAGLQPDDVIVKYGGKDVMSVERLELLIEESAPGTRVDVTCQRGRTQIESAITIGEEKRVVDGGGLQQKLPLAQDLDRTGLVLVELTPEARAAVLGPQAESGGLLVINVLPGGPGFFADLRVRDHVIKVGGRPVANVGEYLQAIEAALPEGEAVFTVRRDGRESETPVDVVEDARDTSHFNFLDIVGYSAKPEGTHFHLLYHLVFKSFTSHSVNKFDATTRNRTSTHWGAVLSLIHWKSTTGGEKELTLGWFFPISWGGD